MTSTRAATRAGVDVPTHAALGGRGGMGLRAEAWTLAAWLLLAGVAKVDPKHLWLLAVLPWCLLAARGRTAGHELVALWRCWRVPLLASAALALWLVLGAGFGVPTQASRLELAAIALLWVPVVALVERQRGAGRRIDGLLAAVVLLVIFANALRVGHQVVVQGVERPDGLTHNVLVGPYLLALALVAAALLRRARLARHLVVAGTALGFGLALGVALLSDARTPLVAGVLALALVSAAWRLRPSRTLTLVLVAALAVWVAGTATRWQEIAEQSRLYDHVTNKTSIGARVDIWRWAAAHVHGLPAFGFGERGLTDRINQRDREFGVAPEQIYALHHMHNDVLQLSYAHGLVAGLAHGVFVAAVLYGLYRRRRGRRADAAHADPVSAAAAAAVLVLAVAGLFDAFVYWPRVWVALQSVYAIVIALHVHAAPPPGARLGRPPHDA